MTDCRTEKETQDLIKRLNRIEGQVKGIKNMLVEDRACMDILHQIRSVSSAMKSVWEIMAANHLENCLENASEQEKSETIKAIVGHLHQLR